MINWKEENSFNLITSKQHRRKQGRQASQRAVWPPEQRTAFSLREGASRGRGPWYIPILKRKKLPERMGKHSGKGEGTAPSATLPRGRGSQSVSSITRGLQASLSFGSLRGREVYKPGNQCWALTGCLSTTVPFWSHYHKTQEWKEGLILGEAA